MDDAAPDDATPIAIVPLMHRHEVEPDDAILRTRMRGAGHAAPLTPVAPDRKAVFFGASYHADYATVLARPADMPAVARAVADALASDATAGDEHPEPWDVIDLRRLRCGDPAADELATAFGAHLASDGWTVVREREEVCPVLDLAPGLGFEGYLGHARQEGAPRGPAQDPARGGRRRGAPGAIDGPDRRPRRVHGPAPAQVGRERALPADARAAPRAAPSSAACSSIAARTASSRCSS